MHGQPTRTRSRRRTFLRIGTISARPRCSLGITHTHSASSSLSPYTHQNDETPPKTDRPSRPNQPPAHHIHKRRRGAFVGLRGTHAPTHTRPASGAARSSFSLRVHRGERGVVATRRECRRRLSERRYTRSAAVRAFALVCLLGARLVAQQVASSRHVVDHVSAATRAQRRHRDAQHFVPALLVAQLQRSARHLSPHFACIRRDVISPLCCALLRLPIYFVLP
ncbi:hypothetical protein EXIGLDRAFT_412714 [Exidia glandulosa HHB12029]|uniref:Uncharacterized protein n=1 Tax=Exidia glandulosa HHB12029 TaxID=1314781 RepID=A0A165BFC2_EXIGL|nr:hypothetical protein EXIGLDRAFT_412714 [Exidia glandulosa HHB12029]